jgi:TetR/AcrR family transcriptional regulator, regulator of cefoperazone and chloramphenicol sensitivity
MSTSDLELTKARTLEAAGQMFAEFGFDGTTIRDICERADANIAAVNYYFGDKQRLYIEAVVQAHRWRLEQFPLPEWPEGTPPETRLADFITTFIRRVRSGPDGTWHAKLMMREMANPSAACGELVQSTIRPQFEILLKLLRELLPADVSQEQLRLTAFSIVGQCLFYHFADPVIRNLLSAEEYASMHVELLANHITKFSLASINQLPSDSGRRKVAQP